MYVNGKNSMNFQDRLVRLDQEKSYVLKKCWRELQSDTKRKKKKESKGWRGVGICAHSTVTKEKLENY